MNFKNVPLNFFLLLFVSITLASNYNLNEAIFEYQTTYKRNNFDNKEVSRINSLLNIQKDSFENLNRYILDSTNWEDNSTILNYKKDLKTFYLNYNRAIIPILVSQTIIDEKSDEYIYFIKVNIKIDKKDIKNKLLYLYNNKKELNILNEIKDKSFNAWLDLSKEKNNLKKNNFPDIRESLIKSYNKSCNIINATNQFINGYKSLFNIDSDHAILFFLGASDYMPNYAPVYNYLGRAYNIINNYKQALDYYIKAIKIDPKYVDVYNNIGNLFFKENNYEKALIYFNKTLDLSPDFYLSYYNKGMVYYEQQNYNQALDNFNKCIKIKPDYARAYYGIGLTYSKKNNFFKSIKYLNHSIQLNNKFIEAHMALGNVNREKNNFSKAIVSYENAILIRQDYAPAYFSIGIIYEKQGNTKKAMKYFLKAQELGYKIKKVNNTY